MADFGDLHDYFEPNLNLPIGGKTYTIKAPTANEGLKLKARVLSKEPMSDHEETTMALGLLGAKWDEEKDTWVGPKSSVYAKMMAEQDWDSVYRAAKTALTYFAISRAFALNFWQTGEFYSTAPEQADPTMTQ